MGRIKKSIITTIQFNTENLSSYINFKMDFKAGLFGCFSSLPNCCAVICCQPCMWGRIAHKVKFLNIGGLVWTIIISILVFGMAIMNQLNAMSEVPMKHLVFGLIALGLTSVLVVLTCSLRTKVRKTNNIAGNPVCDFFVSLCCGICSICQMSTEAGLDEKACHLCNYPEAETV